MDRRNLFSFSLIGLAALIAGALLARSLGRDNVVLTTGTWLPEPRALSDFTLNDTSGKVYDRSRLQGHPTLLFFGFTHCPDVCPTTLAALATVARSAPLPHGETVFVSIDPGHDSASNLRVYLDAFDKSFTGVRGETPALAPLLKSLDAIATRVALPGGDYTMDHSATLYLLDSHGRLRAVFSPPFAPEPLSADLRRAYASGNL